MSAVGSCRFLSIVSNLICTSRHDLISMKVILLSRTAKKVASSAVSQICPITSEGVDIQARGYAS